MLFRARAARIQPMLSLAGSERGQTRIKRGPNLHAVAVQSNTDSWRLRKLARGSVLLCAAREASLDVQGDSLLVCYRTLARCSVASHRGGLSGARVGRTDSI